MLHMFLQAHSVSESLLSGWPLVLAPYGDNFDSMQDMQNNECKLGAMCQVSILLCTLLYFWIQLILIKVGCVLVPSNTFD